MILGITGGVGCGKSTLLSLLASRYGAKILVADEMGHQVMQYGTAIWQEIRKRFGEEIIQENREIDRAALASIIYQDKKKRELLNRIVHPAVFCELEKQLEKWKDEPLVVIETAILFETGCDRLCDQIWWVRAEKETRIQRLTETRGYSREKAEAIMNSQMSDEEWNQRCDYSIDNNGNCENLCVQLKELLGR